MAPHSPALPWEEYRPRTARHWLRRRLIPPRKTERVDRLRGALPLRDVDARPCRRADVAGYVRSDVSRTDAAAGPVRDHHALVVVLCRHAPWVVRAGARSLRASPHDPRHGGPAADLHDGRIEAPAVRHAGALHRMRREPRAAPAHNRPGNTRVDQLCRMDRGSSLAVAPGSGRAERRVLDRGGRCRGGEGIVEPSARAR